MPREHLKGTSRQEQRAISTAVITQGGRHIWLSGVGECTDGEGRSLADDFDAQVYPTFRSLAKVIEQVSGKLTDMMAMTVFIADSRYGDRFTAIRKEFFRIAIRQVLSSR